MLTFQADAASLLRLVERFGIWRLWAATILTTSELRNQIACLSIVADNPSGNGEWTTRESLLCAALVTRRTHGRKPTPQILTAVRMRSENMAWPQVYAAVIDDYAKLHPCERLL